jgi:hypothetical protein
MGARRSWIALAVGLVGAAIPASPAAAAVTIGQLAPGSPPAANCNASPFDSVQPSVTGGNTYVVPATGTVTSWSTNAAAGAGQMLTMKIFRKVGEPATYMVVGHDGPRPLAPSSVNTFPASIPVEAGDVLGLNDVNASFATPNACLFDAPGDRVEEREGDLPDGASGDFDIVESDFRLNVTAEIEPDCDSDGLGDETQDPNPFGGNCAPRGRTLTLDANKNKVKKGKKVTLSGQVNEIVRQGPCESGQTVQLQRKRPKATTFTTVQELQTDAGGSFSRKRKVKKTFEYRAQLPETATCAGQTSNTEKVKVKKKK